MKRWLILALSILVHIILLLLAKHDPAALEKILGTSFFFASAALLFWAIKGEAEGEP